MNWIWVGLIAVGLVVMLWQFRGHQDEHTRLNLKPPVNRRKRLDD